MMMITINVSLFISLVFLYSVSADDDSGKEFEVEGQKILVSDVLKKIEDVGWWCDKDHMDWPECSASDTPKLLEALKAQKEDLSGAFCNGLHEPGECKGYEFDDAGKAVLKIYKPCTVKNNAVCRARSAESPGYQIGETCGPASTGCFGNCVSDCHGWACAAHGTIVEKSFSLCPKHMWCCCSATIAITCQNLEVHRMTFSLNETVASFRKRAAGCCGINDKKTAVVDYWPYPCQTNTGFNEVWEVERTMGECGYLYSSKGLTILMAERKYKQTNSMASYLNIYAPGSKVLKIDITNDPLISDFKQHIASYTGLDAKCITLAEWYINPKVDEDGGQLMDGKRFSDYGITPENKNRMIIILVNKDCKPLTPGTWIMYGKNIVVNIDCKDDETVKDFKERAAAESGVPIDKMWIFDLLPNPKQDADGGQLKPEREMSYYGGCKGKIFVVGTLLDCGKRA